jgi:acetylornithine/succinyldiaminopimelate/putrescine aminotransferase
MMAVELKRPATPAIKALQVAGVLALPGGANVIRLLPSLLLEKTHVDQAVEAISRAVTVTTAA